VHHALASVRPERTLGRPCTVSRDESNERSGPLIQLEEVVLERSVRSNEPEDQVLEPARGSNEPEDQVLEFARGSNGLVDGVRLAADELFESLDALLESADLLLESVDPVRPSTLAVRASMGVPQPFPRCGPIPSTKLDIFTWAGQCLTTVGKRSMWAPVHPHTPTGAYPMFHRALAAVFALSVAVPFAGCAAIGDQTPGEETGSVELGAKSGKKNPCMTVKCAAGTHCEAHAGQAACVQDDQTCSTDADCRLFDDYCDGCACEALSVSSPDPFCSSGNYVQCFAQPCGGKVAVCKAGLCEVASEPVGEACGPNVCGAGQVCCNASCGMCAAPDEFCIQIACTPE